MSLISGVVGRCWFRIFLGILDPVVNISGILADRGSFLIFFITGILDPRKYGILEEGLSFLFLLSLQSLALSLVLFPDNGRSLSLSSALISKTVAGILLFAGAEAETVPGNPSGSLSDGGVGGAAVSTCDPPPVSSKPWDGETGGAAVVTCDPSPDPSDSSPVA